MDKSKIAQHKMKKTNIIFRLKNNNFFNDFLSKEMN